MDRTPGADPPWRPACPGALAAILAACCLCGCAGAAPRRGRELVAAEIGARTGLSIRPEEVAAEPAVPEGVNLADGISEDEAVALALWNNTAFQETLAGLGASRADLIQAGLLRNPVFSILFPLGPKQLEFAAAFPLEALWLRSKRVAAADLDYRNAAEALVQSGLDLVRDARRAHADLVLAGRRAGFAGEASSVRSRIAELAEARLRAGDASEIEAGAARADALLAAAEAAAAERDLRLAAERLRFLAGLAFLEMEIAADASNPPLLPEPPPDLPSLLAASLAARPDLRAAELAIEAARERGGLARWGILTAAGILDANKEDRGLDLGPGLELEVPLFNRNQGGIARADAELEMALRHHAAVRHRIALEVREAHARLIQAAGELQRWRGEILPRLAAAARGSERAYAAGEISLLLVLESSRKLVEARAREAEAEAEVRRGRADLERAVGRKLETGARTGGGDEGAEP